MPHSSARKSLVEKVRGRLVRFQHRRQLLRETHHIHGPRHCFAPPEAVVLICLVRNGTYYLDAFLGYYRGLGVKHFVFIDNGSTDDTVARLKAEPNTAILQTHLPWGRFENDLRNLAASRYGQDRWCLIVDMDELFEFEGQERLGLSGLTTWLQNQGYTGVMAQMIEMFPKAPLSEVADLTYAEVLDQFDHIDVSTIDAVGYHDQGNPLSYFLQQNTTPNAQAQVLFGGVRKKVFGEDCCLTKHPLVFNGSGVEAGVHPHAATGLNLAPFTAAIRHYKFANDSLSRDRASISEGSIAHGEDRQRVDVMSQTPDLTLWSDTAQKYTGIRQLQLQGILLSDNTYSEHVATYDKTTGAKSISGQGTSNG